MAAPSYIDGQTQDAAGALSLTFTMSTITHTTGDLLIAFVKQSENTTQRTWDDDGGGGNGWTRAVYNRTTGGRDQETAIFWKFAASGSESNPTFTWNTTGTTEPMSGSLLVYRGVDTLVPFQGPTYASATNDANPPNPAILVVAINTRVVCFHAATHDDITTVAAPTGFTLRTQVWNGTANDHRNHFTADIERDTVESYTPPDWQHSVSNNTPEYHTYTMALNEAQPIHITGGTILTGFNWGDINLTIAGDGFEASQGTGKVEIWDDVVGTTKTTQTIDSWSATSIQIDTVQGSLPTDTTVYVVVTNNSAETNAPKSVTVGLIPYNEMIVDTLKADHYWRLNNTYNDTGDTGPTRNMTSAVTGTWTFNTQEIVDGNTHCLNFASVTNRREISDSANMNVTGNFAERTLSCWIQLDEIQHDLGALWKEGGGVQNLAFLVGYGNVLLFQGADTPGNAINAQAWSDFKLKTGRPYHICGRYTLSESPKELRLYIDGIEQTETSGNPLGVGNFDSHSGDVVWGDPDANLETGGTDIAYAGLNDAQVSDFATWSDNSAGTNAGALHKTDEIRNILYRRGALPDDTISTGTESAMQASVEALNETRPDWPLSLRVEPPTGGGDFELKLEDGAANPWVFNDDITSHVEFRGSGTLTLINPVGGNVDVAKCWSESGGTIAVVNEVEVLVKVQDFNGVAIQSARVLITADTGNDLPYQDSVTITRSGSTATVTHTAHGLRTGLEILIEDAAESEYNGIYTITVTTVNAYTYTVSGTPTSPATGTIVSTSVLLNGTTDVSGELSIADHRYTGNQAVIGYSRKGTSASFFKQSDFSGTITSNGLNINFFMIGDE